MKIPTLGSAALFAALAVTACGGATFHMRRTASPEITPPSTGHALVVFAMPSGRDVVTILDQYGVYFGQLRGGHYFAREVDPGPHRFYAVRNVEGHVVHTEALVAGRTYYVVVESPFAAPFRIRGLPCAEDGASTLTARGGELTRVEPDPAVSEEEVRRAIGDEPMRMHEADQRWERLTDTQRSERTLRSCASPDVAAADTVPGVSTVDAVEGDASPASP